MTKRTRRLAAIEATAAPLTTEPEIPTLREAATYFATTEGIPVATVLADISAVAPPAPDADQTTPAETLRAAAKMIAQDEGIPEDQALAIVTGMMADIRGFAAGGLGRRS